MAMGKHMEKEQLERYLLYIIGLNEKKFGIEMMLFIIFSLLTGYVVDVEVHTPNGRVDIVLLTDIRLYIIELKLNRDAQTALLQINLKNYAQRFALCGKPIVKVGVNFDSTQGNIEDWIIEEE